MNDPQLFRWLFIAIFVIAISISGYFRRKARQSGEVIQRGEEGRLFLALRVLFAAPFYLSVLAYMIYPNWMAWSEIRLPGWLRWLGVLTGVGMLPILYWVMKSIGRNVSETVLTKEYHALVTHGPYRWVRHSLYSVAMVAFISLGIVAGNGFIFAMAVLLIMVVGIVVIPKEETHLIQKFGDEYRKYQQKTGRLFPRLNLRRY